MPNERDGLTRRKSVRALRGLMRPGEIIRPEARPALVAAVTVIALAVGILVGRALRGVADHGGEDARVSWTGVVDRVESGKAVVIPFGGLEGGSTRGDDVASLSEVVMPLYLLPPGSDEGAVLDFAATARPGDTRARTARIEALVLRLKSTSSRRVPCPEAARGP
ncbi:MAG: DUF3006 domain-containing protein [Betaproteobacteria bacterium]